jgi:hypothetical protein
MSKKSPKENFDKYLTTWAGKHLLETHRLSDTGIWEIRGEDPNCDLAGAHYQPQLGIVEGVLEDVIMHGANLPNFWQWGSGGEFRLIGKTIPKVDANSALRRQELEDEAAELEKKLKEVKRKLGKM